MSIFNFKYFNVQQKDATMKVGTDALVLGSLIDVNKKTKALDIGSGTGVLSLIIAQRSKNIIIDSLEIDSKAATECNFNYNQSPWNDRLHVYNIDFLEFYRDNSYDLIFSNPPFYQTSQLNQNMREVLAKHVIELTPVVFMEKISDLLCESGDLWIIVPFHDMFKWVKAAEKYALFLTKRTDVIGKRNGKTVRSILNFNRTNSGRVTRGELTIRESDGTYSEEYVALTRELHGKSL